jgi:hypothetical protein
MQLDEVTQDELAKIEHIAAGEQFPNIFGGDQRIIIEHTDKVIRSDITTGFQGIDSVMVPVAANAIERFINKISYSGARYEIDYGNALFVKTVMRQIPAGPRAGEYEEKTTKYKLSALQDAIQSWTERNNSAEFNEKMGRLFADAKPNEHTFVGLITLLQSELKNAMQQSVKGGSRFNEKDVNAYDIWSTIPKYFDFFYTNSGDSVIVISRAPVDLLRMSDFPGKGGTESGIVSCHSPPRKKGGGQYFACAIHEAKHNGAVAYLVPRKSVEEHKDKLQSREFFKDLEREGTQGAYPIQRIRLRRYIYSPTGEEILVPENTIYGQHMSEAFSRDLSKWARSVQSDKIAHILKKEEQEPRIHVAKFILVGGSYSDTESEILLEYFLGQEISTKEFAGAVHDIGGKQIDQNWVTEADDQKFGESLARFAGVNTFSVTRLMKDKKLSIVTKRTPESVIRNVVLNNAMFPVSAKTQKLLVLARSKNEIQFENYLKKLITEYIFKPSVVQIRYAYADYNPSTKSVTYGVETSITLPANGVFSKELLNQIMSVGNAIKMCHILGSSVGAYIDNQVGKDSSSQTVAETKKLTKFVMRERKNV